MSCKIYDILSQPKINVCLIVSNLDKYKYYVYDSIRRELNEVGCNVDIKVHHGDQEIFARLIRMFLEKYTHFVIVPYFRSEPNGLTISLIKEVPENRLIFLDKDFQPKTHKAYGAVLQNYEEDLFRILTCSIEKIQRYSRFILVFPAEEQGSHPISMINGFAKFCSLNLMDFMVVDSLNGFNAAEGDLYLVLEDSDLVDLIKLSKRNSLRVGREVGVLSFDQSPLKEVLENGISVLSYDFDEMAKRTVEMILTGNLTIEKNTFSLIQNSSF